MGIKACLVELPTEKQAPGKGKFCLVSNLLCAATIPASLFLVHQVGNIRHMLLGLVTFKKVKQ